MGASAQRDADGLAPEQIRVCLGRILEDRRFVHSQGLSRFLRYTVEETLAGRGETLKETVLGIEVFERGNSFDPRVDPIVRIQAGKLRARLQEYFQAEGAGEEVLIEYHKGGYTPTFRSRPQCAVPSTPPALESPAGSSNRANWILAGGATMLLLIVALAFLARPSGHHAQSLVERLTSDTGGSIFPAISRDGDLVVYSSDRAGNNDLDLWVVSRSGGRPVRLTDTPGADITADFSPDAQRVVFRSNGDQPGLYLVRVLGGEQTRLTDTGWQPRFSPDGNRIVYQGPGKRAGGGLWVIPAGGGQPRPIEISNDVWLGAVPRWTPDGKYILFLGFDSSRTADWWVVPAEGGEAVRSGLAERLRGQGLGELDADSTPGDWLGSEMVFSLVRGATANLWVVPFSTHSWTVSGGVRQLTFGSAMELSPHASAYGRVVFSGGTLLTHIWSVPVDSGEPRQLTRDSSLRPGHYRAAVRFSISDGLLAFASLRSGNSAIWIQDLATGTEQPLAASPDPEEHPLLSPDGAWVVYVVAVGGRRALYVSEVERRLSRKLCDDCGDPYGWLPDSHTILYGAPHGRATDLAAIDVNSGARQRWACLGDRSVRHASVSPDARWVMLAVGDQDGQVRLIAAPLENGAPALPARWITVPSVDPEGPAVFSPAGDRIFYLGSMDGYRCLWSHSFQPDSGGVGAPEPWRHFHDSHLRPWNSWLSISSNRLAMTMTESNSNLWTLQVSR